MCGVAPTGGVPWCWGYNTSGESGTTPSEGVAPTQIDAVASKVVAGTTHSCALEVFGGVRCWGNNDNGELGNGLYSDFEAYPVPVGGLSGVLDIDAGNSSTCVIVGPDRRVKCWGYGGYGQLGNGITGNSPVPVDVDGLSGVAQLSLGDGFACARLMGGSVWCWGENLNGNLGNGSFTDSSRPVAVDALTDVVDISGSVGHVCAVLGSGAVYCWGWNRTGQLADGTTNNSPRPLRIAGFG